MSRGHTGDHPEVPFTSLAATDLRMPRLTEVGRPDGITGPMNWRYLVGRSRTRVANALMANRMFPLSNAIGFGSCWPYDAMRFSGTRDLRMILDVGANVGQTAIYLRDFFPRAVIHSFEPVSSTFAQLQANTSRAKYPILVHNCALSDRIGAAEIFLDQRDSGMNSLEPRPNTDSCAVRLDTLDNFCATHGIPSVDVLKIDVEGHELAVLRGANTLLQQKRIRFVYAEVVFEGGDPHHTSYTALLEHLLSFGYVFSGLYELWRYPAARGRIGFGNALFWQPGFAAPEHVGDSRQTGESG